MTPRRWRAIEKLIGQPIPWMSETAGSAPLPQPAVSGRREAAPAAPPRTPGTGIDNRIGPLRASASVARLPQRTAQSPQPVKPRSEDGDASHLPAFLLRPVPVKA